MTSDIPYDWNWAELEEARQAQQEAQRSLFDERPELAVFFGALFEDFSPSHDPVPLDLLTPSDVAGLPPNLSALACALANPHAGQATLWRDWILAGRSDDERAVATLAALKQITQNVGPIHAVSPILLEQALASLAPLDGSLFCSSALVGLFQPFDRNPEPLEDLPFAPCCAVLLAAGADPSARNARGASALSGINALLTEAEISMADPDNLGDLLLCAHILLDAGAAPDTVRERPPFSDVVPNVDLREMLLARQERDSVTASLPIAPEATSAAATPSAATTRNRL
jgi:hypothetical protein